MPSLASLRPLTKTADIDTGYGIVRVTYLPRQLVDTAEDERRRRNDADDKGENFNANEICRVLAEWDLTGPVPIEDIPGHPKGSAFDGSETDIIPIKPEIVRFIDSTFLNILLAGLVVDGQPDPLKMVEQSRRRGSTGIPTSPTLSSGMPTPSQNGSTTT